MRISTRTNESDALWVVQKRRPAGRKGSQRLSVPSQATSKPSRASVETAPALDEVTQRLVKVLAFRRESEGARPFAPRPVIDLGTIGRAKDHSSERFRLP